MKKNKEEEEIHNNSLNAASLPETEKNILDY